MHILQKNEDTLKGLAHHVHVNNNKSLAAEAATHHGRNGRPHAPRMVKKVEGPMRGVRGRYIKEAQWRSGRAAMEVMIEGQQVKMELDTGAYLLPYRRYQETFSHLPLHG